MLKALILHTLIFLHPIHVTLTTIDQAPGSDTLKVFFRMYYDDFLRDYKSYDADFSIAKKSAVNLLSDEKLNNYFNSRVHLYINNRLLPGKLTAVSNDNIEITLRLIYKSEKTPEKFKIVHQVLTRLYSDQANMIYINIDNYQDAMKLTPDHYTEKRILK